jgi:hypothetical protein
MNPGKPVKKTVLFRIFIPHFFMDQILIQIIYYFVLNLIHLGVLKGEITQFLDLRSCIHGVE